MSRDASTRQTILEAARDVFLEAGLPGLSMRKVAARSGITATAIYRHFEHKEALLTAICEAGFEVFGSYLMGSLGEATAVTRLDETGMGYMRFGLENPGYYRVIFMSSAEDLGWEAMPESNREKLGPTFQFLVDRVRECIDEGVFAPADPVTLAGHIWAQVHGLVSLYLSGGLRPVIHSQEQFEGFFRDSLQRMREGLQVGG